MNCATTVVVQNGGRVSRSKDFLLSEFTRRSQKNQNYSIRAFARDLDICKSSLAYVLAGERDLSQKNKRRVAEKLRLSPKETQRLLGEDSGYRKVEEDQFYFIADWFCLATFCLLQTRGAKADPHWVAQKLGLPKAQAQLTLDRLTRMGFVDVSPEGEITCKEITLKTREDLQSTAIRRHHSQNLERASQVLENIAVEDREITSITFTGDPAKLPWLKKEIRKFRDTIYKKMQDSDPKDVFTMAIQLFPQTKKERSR
jgi:hypothetical protein